MIMFLNLYSVRDSQHSKQASWFANRGLGCINSGLQQNRSFLPSTVIAYKCHLISSLLTRTSWINTDKFTMFTNVWNFTSRFIYLFVYYSSNYFYRHSFFIFFCIFFFVFLSFKLLLVKYILILQVNWPFPGGFQLFDFFKTIICVKSLLWKCMLILQTAFLWYSSCKSRGDYSPQRTALQWCPHVGLGLCTMLWYTWKFCRDS